MKTLIGYTHLLINLAGAIVSGAMGIAFVVLAVYLVYTGMAEAAAFQVRLLMMPTMNILISSVLFYYCHLLFGRTKTVKQNLLHKTYIPPHIQATRYDIVAIISFISFIILIYFIFIA